MVSIGVIISSIVGILATIASIVLIIINWRKFSPISVEKNLPIVHNYLQKFTEGHYEFLEKSVKPMPNETLLCTLLPLDFKINNKGEIKDFKEYKMLIKKRNRIVHPSGTLSPRDIVEYLPNFSGELPDASILNKGTQTSFISGYNKLMANEYMKDKALGFHMRQFAGGEVSRMQFQKEQDIRQEMLKNIQSQPRPFEAKKSEEEKK